MVVKLFRAFNVNTIYGMRSVMGAMCVLNMGNMDSDQMISVLTEKGKTMTDRKKLIELAHDYFKSVPWYADIADLNPEELIDHLFANGVTIPKRGRWIIHSSGGGEHATNWAECSECRVCGSPQWKVCPVCETKMEGY